MPKPIDPNKLRPRTKDLFKQVPVTLDELYEWVNEKVPQIAHSKTRMDWYIKGYNVAEKVRIAKLLGTWPPA